MWLLRQLSFILSVLLLFSFDVSKCGAGIAVVLPVL